MKVGDKIICVKAHQAPGTSENVHVGFISKIVRYEEDSRYIRCKFPSGSDWWDYPEYWKVYENTIEERYNNTLNGDNN